jgi:acetyl esterase/lipase
MRYGPHPDHIADIRFSTAAAAAGAQYKPLVLIVHGGFWRPQYDRTHTGPMAEAIADAGYTVASVEYRRIPGDPDKTLSDVSNALAELPTRIDKHNGKVILVGHSAGGHLVLWLTQTRRSPALIGTLALAPAADLQLAHDLNLGDGAVQSFLGAPPGTRQDVDPRLLPSPQVPTSIIHGEKDVVVRLSISESYVAAHPGVKLVKVTGVGHFAPIDPLSSTWPTVMRELLALG